MYLATIILGQSPSIMTMAIALNMGIARLLPLNWMYLRCEGYHLRHSCI